MQTARVQPFDMNATEIMNVAGRFDGGNAEDILNDAKLRMQMGARKLVLDCMGLNYLTAGGMHAMADIAKEVRARQGVFAVCNLRGQPKSMFDACGFEQIIPSYGNQAEAVAQIAA